ncbi:hypothetical protein IWQ47_001920 [Aquimarina sp. EL_43]|uniref:hypothetical protein n=1 Tax=Aquimarina TaxID=290174 RepID=UPI00046E9965|nr:MULTISPECIES: hypothetical protein [Aquimarina]MBG6129997.1 hypothetical protein [Aquimarina sp. EL_35]MBG6148777.1 hypothetical protein [Aquimarina sp. EL_32]MBG6168849.1 hypothetical protein [Aquimarina sp. EL_43]
MEKTIETTWKEGFLKKPELAVPQITILYNQKSKHIVEKLFSNFQNSLYFLIILSILIPIVMVSVNISFWWSITPSLFCLLYFYTGRKQFLSLKKIEYNTNCYDYLKSINSKLKAINRINLRNTVLGVGFMLSPLVIYTYFNNKDTNLGNILGIGYIDLPNELLFIILPITMMITIPFYKIMVKAENKNERKIVKLIKSIEELNQV